MCVIEFLLKIILFVDIVDRSIFIHSVLLSFCVFVSAVWSWRHSNQSHVITKPRIKIEFFFKEIPWRPQLLIIARTFSRFDRIKLMIRKSLCYFERKIAWERWKKKQRNFRKLSRKATSVCCIIIETSSSSVRLLFVRAL